MSNITPAFCVALAKLQALLPAIPKSATNPHFKSKFAPHDALISLTNKLLSEHGFSVVQTFETSELTTVNITDDKGSETRTVVSNILVTYLIHESGGYIESHLNIGAVDNMLKYGGLITYFRRYAHFSILGIVGDVDDDGGSVTQLDRAETLPRKAAPLNTPAFTGMPTTPPTGQKRQLL